MMPPHSPNAGERHILQEERFSALCFSYRAIASPEVRAGLETFCVQRDPRSPSGLRGPTSAWLIRGLQEREGSNSLVGKVSAAGC